MTTVLTNGSEPQSPQVDAHAEIYQQIFSDGRVLSGKRLMVWVQGNKHEVSGHRPEALQEIARLYEAPPLE